VNEWSEYNLGMNIDAIYIGADCVSCKTTNMGTITENNEIIITLLFINIYYFSFQRKILIWTDAECVVAVMVKIIVEFT
jgi:hypothetical protein